MLERDHLDGYDDDIDDPFGCRDDRDLRADRDDRVDDDRSYGFWRPPEPTLDDDMAPELIELEKIPRRLWKHTLGPVHPLLRYDVARQVGDAKLQALALKVIEDLEDADMAARQARSADRLRGRQTAAPVPTPDVTHHGANRTVQINLRLPRDDHSRLKEAAIATGMKPTTLARALVLNGVAKVLRERGAT
jgi:hypothetical protein